MPRHMHSAATINMPHDQRIFSADFNMWLYNYIVSYQTRTIQYARLSSYIATCGLLTEGSGSRRSDHDTDRQGRAGFIAYQICWLYCVIKRVILGYLESYLYQATFFSFRSVPYFSP